MTNVPFVLFGEKYGKSTIFFCVFCKKMYSFKKIYHIQDEKKYKRFYFCLIKIELIGMNSHVKEKTTKNIDKGDNCNETKNFYI
jgi:hypothetical protein